MIDEDQVKPAKTCFGHIGRKLGMLLMENLLKMLDR